MPYQSNHRSPIQREVYGLQQTGGRVSARNVEVVSVTFTHINQQPEMLCRPYTPVANGREAVDAIASAIEANAGGNVTPAMIANIGAGKMFAPSAVPIGSMYGNDWREEKLAVKIVLRITHGAFGTESFSYLSGYTDYAGYSTYGAADVCIDPNMQIFITSAISTTAKRVRTPRGEIVEEVLSGNLNTPTSTGGTHELFFGLRPCDITSHVSDDQLAKYVGDDVETTNGGTQFQLGVGTALPSRPDNNIGARYIAKIVNAGLAWGQSGSGSMDHYGLGDSRAMQGVEPGIRSIAGLSEISTAAGYFNKSSTKFPFSALLTIDPNTDAKTSVIQRDMSAGLRLVSVFRDSVPDSGEKWEGSDMETRIAYTLLQETVAMAEGFGLGMVRLQACNHNQFIPYEDQVVILGAETTIVRLAKDSFARALQLFKDQFATVIWANIDRAYGRDLDCKIEYDSLNTSRCKVSLDGGPGVWFTCPTVGTALAAPVWSPSHEQVNTMAHAIDLVAQSVTDQTVNNY